MPFSAIKELICPHDSALKAEFRLKKCFFEKDILLPQDTFASDYIKGFVFVA